MQIKVPYDFTRRMRSQVSALDYYTVQTGPMGAYTRLHGTPHSRHKDKRMFQCNLRSCRTTGFPVNR